jgi:hypothetical protein
MILMILVQGNLNTFDMSLGDQLDMLWQEYQEIAGMGETGTRCTMS